MLKRRVRQSDGLSSQRGGLDLGSVIRNCQTIEHAARRMLREGEHIADERLEVLVATMTEAIGGLAEMVVTTMAV
jgi:hypothetical protein